MNVPSDISSDKSSSVSSDIQLNNLPHILEISELDYFIENIQILKNINFQAGKGEFIGLIGPNGAGKTTLLKCINGINKGNGQVFINKKTLERLSNKRIAREVALMHQNTSVSFPFPSIDVVLAGRYPYLKFASGETIDDFRIARKYMEYTGTSQFEKKPITTVSGGERQRIFFAKILTQETDIILLDEPTSNLDIAYEEQIFRYCNDLCNNGKTVIAAVHDLKIASRYCSRLILMKEGEIIADGKVDEVLTSGNLSEAYGVNALVYRNRVTGLLDFYIPGFEHRKEYRHVHIIGGGGSASGVIRQLFERGFCLSTGVLSYGDSDLNCAEVFEIKRVVNKPFSGISDEAFNENIKYIRESDITILCNMPFGIYNIRNLDAARYASNLVIIEDDSPEVRDFTEGKALEIYKELKKNAIVTTYARLHEVIVT
ncbi:MAG TPA: ABC transporter ATP-binding protein [Clostridiales bacterium]|nr:ABC transporter ATP-binding protein [Clostridiales bacterium]